MGHFAAFGPIKNLWATSRPIALQYNGVPLCGPFPIFSKFPEFGEFTLKTLISKYRVNSPNSGSVLNIGNGPQSGPSVYNKT